MADNDNEPQTPQYAFYDDGLYDEARKHVLETQRCSISDLQRTFKIGFNRASAIIEQLIEDSILDLSPH